MNTQRESLERVTIVGYIKDRDKARTYCQAEGFRIVQDTPHIITAERVDPHRFKIIAEKSTTAYA